MLRVGAAVLSAVWFTAALENHGHSKYGGAYHAHAKKDGKTHAKGSDAVVDCKVPECPEGFIRKGGYCVQGEIVPPEETCPDGSYYDDGMCVMTMDGTAICEKGTNIGGLFCEIKEVVNSKLSCPEGSIDQGDQCFVGGLAEYCPAGTAKTSEGKCLTTKAKEFFCPPHLKDVGGICVEYDYAKSKDICPEDTELIHGECVAEVERKPVCPKGFADEGDRCAAFETPIRDVCPDGYIYDADQFLCTDKTYVDAEPECPDGGELIEDMCTKYIPGPTGPICEEGVLVDGICRVQSSTEPDFVCPAGYDLEATPTGPICSKSIPYDCSVPCDEGKHGHSHTKGYTHGGVHSHGGIHRKLDAVDYQKNTFYKGGHSKVHYHKAAGTCVGLEPVEPKTCYETVIADAIPICPPGAAYNGIDGCVVTDLFPPTPECLATEDDQGRCVIKQTYKPVFYCPEGYVPVGSGMQCESVEFVQPEIRCPDDTEEFEGKCAIFVDKACPKEGCIETIKWTPDVTCPVDYTLVLFDVSKGKKHINHEERCVKEKYIKQWTTCPEGFSPLDDLSCGVHESPVIRRDEVIIKAQEICPVGYAAIECGDRCDSFFVCEKKSFSPATLTCPDGFYAVMGTELCARQVPVVPTCPKGSEEINGECTITVRTNPLMNEYPGKVVPVPKGKKHYHAAASTPKKVTTKAAPTPKAKPTANAFPKAGVKAGGWGGKKWSAWW